LKILAGADIHGKQYRINQIIENVKKFEPELVVICGDITQFGPKELAKVFLDQIPVDVMAVPGNIDTEDVIDGIEESKAINLHLKKVRWKDYTFVGIGGSNPLPFRTKLWYSEEEIEKELGNLLEKDCILVTHIPPYGIQDRVFFGKHAGSKVLRDIVERFSPKLHLCGHIHENPGFDKLGDTIVVNCTMARGNGGALIDIKDDDIKVEMLSE
jgi:hypothetical protein